MLLKKIILHNFRNFSKKEFLFSPTLTVIYGENARGKTNLLEAVYCLSHGSGFRETKEEELMKIGESKTLISGRFINSSDQIEIKIGFNKKKELIDKKYFINKTAQRLVQLRRETVASVLFSPQQLEIITGAPDQRRQYFDRIISFYDLEYKKRLVNYEHALRKRNKLLEIYRDQQKLKEELYFWDDYLEEQADYINKLRKHYINFLNDNQKIDDKKFSVVYLENLLTAEKLSKILTQEMRYRRTLIGPQKDDFKIEVVESESSERKNLHLFGSRSEHRLGIFWLKLNEIRYYEKQFKKKPILLLDDIFSELDLNNKKLILDLIKNYQTILTTAEAEIVKLSHRLKTIIKLSK